MNIYFKGIRAINPEQNLDAKVNLWVKDGKIAHCDSSDVQVDKDTKVIDSANLAVAPGLFDMHVHLREPGEEYKETIETGCNAAANGGFTGVLCMPNTQPVIDDATVVEFIKQRSKEYLTDVVIAAALTHGRQGKQLSQMLLELNDYGVKMFTDDGACVSSSEVLRRAFDYSAPQDLLISEHCEDKTLTEGFSANESKVSGKLGLKGYPAVAEEIILSRDIMLADYCGNRRYHASHLSTQGSVELVRKAKSNKQRVSAEVTPHHFVLNENLVESYDTNLKMNPPLRAKQDIDAILKGLADGTIDCIASDHAPHSLNEKDVEYEKAPYGIIGLETSLALSLTYLVHTNVLTLSQLIEKMSTNPRKILGLEPISFAKDSEANLTIFNPDEEWIVNKDNFRSKSKNSPFNEYKLKGKPYMTINKKMTFESNL